MFKIRSLTVKSLALAVAISSSVLTFADRQTSYGYNSLDQVTSVDGPRTDVNDITYYDYDLTTANLLSMTNAVGHQTFYSNYTGGGLAQTITTPNGAIINVTYDWKGNVLSQDVVSTDGTQSTVYVYDKAFNLESVQLPNGSVIYYEYDNAQRLIGMSNNDGERIDYTLDSAGNITTQQVKDSSANIVRQHTQVFDDLNRVREHIGGTDSQTTQLGYDADSRNTSVIDPKNNPATQNSYDALNRLTQVVDSAYGTTTMTYNAQGLIETVTDPRGLTTTYGYNGFGELESIDSPDTGTTTFTHDDAGNVTSRTNANGTVVNYSYDALNRLTEQSYPSEPTKNVLYTYDDTGTGFNSNVDANYGLVQLTTITYFGGQIDYQFDQLGRLVAEQRSFGGQSYLTEYAFNAVGQLTQLTYPSGRLVNYQYDSQGRLLALTTQETASAAEQTVVSNLDYLPFGPATGFDYGNGITQEYRYDLDYRLTDIVSNVQDWVYRYDLNSNIESITNNIDTTNNQTYSYDELNRLISASGAYGDYTYDYDAVGNRTQRQLTTATETTTGTTTSTTVEDLTYAADANQLDELTTQVDAVQTDSRLFTYSASGQLITDINNDRTIDYSYDENDRLAQADIYGSPEVATYDYNPLGQRLIKTVEGNIEHIHYDAQGQRLAETDASGNVIREYIYLGQQAIAMVVGNTDSTNEITSYSEQIEAEHYDNAYDTTAGNAGNASCGTGDVDVQPTSDTGGGCNVGWVATGEWLEYTINVPTSGQYEVVLRASSKRANRSVNVTLDGDNDFGSVIISKGTWQNFSDYILTGTLDSGEHTLRVTFTNGLVNLNYVVVTLTEPEISADDTAGLYFVHNDHLGTPKLLTDTTGTIVWEMHTTPFGEVHSEITTGVNNLKAFPGQYADDETGLNYNYFRDYDPSIGRYIQSDPIGLNGGLNTYGYVGGNPLSYVDPYGLAAIEIDVPPGTYEWIPENIRLPAMRALGWFAVVVQIPGSTPLPGTEGDVDQCEEENDNACDPPEGTICSEFHMEGAPHKATDFDGNPLGKIIPHVHTYRMNKAPSGCFWNKMNSANNTHNFTPVAARACSSYESWNAQYGR